MPKSKSESAQPVELRLGSANANKIWLNGKLLADAEVYHAFTTLDQYVGSRPARAGNQSRPGQTLPERADRRLGRELEVSDPRLRPHRRSSRRAGENSVNGDDNRAAMIESTARRLPRSPRLIALRFVAADSTLADGWRHLRPAPAAMAPGLASISRTRIATARSTRPICPPTLDDGLTIAWKVDLPGRGPSSPIVVGGRVIITASSGVRQDLLHVLAFDAADGHLLVAAAVLGHGPHAHASANGRSPLRRRPAMAATFSPSSRRTIWSRSTWTETCSGIADWPRIFPAWVTTSACPRRRWSSAKR